MIYCKVFDFGSVDVGDVKLEYIFECWRHKNFGAIFLLLVLDSLISIFVAKPFRLEHEEAPLALVPSWYYQHNV